MGILKGKDEGSFKFTFKFTNTGTEPLIISHAISSCGCSVASSPREPIMPSQSGIIYYRYDARRIGPCNKTITVFSNAKTPTVVLKTHGRVYDEASPPKYNFCTRCHPVEPKMAQKKADIPLDSLQKIEKIGEGMASKKVENAAFLSSITISIYPNPFSSQATIESDKNLTGAKLTVFNLAGQAVKEIENISTKSVVLSRRNLPSGPYIVHLSQDNQMVATAKILITD